MNKGSRTFKRVFAIGDIHGDFEGMMDVLTQMVEAGMDINGRQDLLVFIGDYIDGYDRSRDVVSTVRVNQIIHPDNVIALKGNHEELCVEAQGRLSYDPYFRTWWSQGGRQTYKSYMVSNHVMTHGQVIEYPDNLTEDAWWFSNLPLYHETEDFIFVHAGLRPGVPLAENTSEDMLWIRDEFLRTDYHWGKIVVHGHTPGTEPTVLPNRININTRWRGGGYVTGCELFKDKPPVFYKPDNATIERINSQYSQY